MAMRTRCGKLNITVRKHNRENRANNKFIKRRFNQPHKTPTQFEMSPVTHKPHQFNQMVKLGWLHTRRLGVPQLCPGQTGANRSDALLGGR